jgi:hypothetical protein
MVATLKKLGSAAEARSDKAQHAVVLAFCGKIPDI